MEQEESKPVADYIKWPEPDKLLIFAVPYLIMLAYAFYAGYWGELKVDIYPYLQLQDIVNGAAYALRWSLAGIILSVIGIIFSNLIVAIAFKVSRTSVGIALVLTTLLAAFLYIMWTDLIVPSYHFWRNEPYKEPLLGNIFSTWSIPSPLFGQITAGTLLVTQWYMSYRYPNIFNFKLYKNKKDKDRFSTTIGADFWPYLRHYSFLASLIMAPLFAFSTGYYDAKNIISSRNFDFIHKDLYKLNLLLKPYTYLKYLGKAGGTHFLLTPDNKKRIALSADSLGTLILQESSMLRRYSLPRQDTTTQKKRALRK